VSAAMRVEGDGWPRRTRVVGNAPVVVALVAVVLGLRAGGAGIDRRSLEVSWQLIDLGVLRDDPLGSIWYLHVQPPLYNLVVGSVLRWAPTPELGTLFVLYVVCLLVAGLLLTDLLVRWGVHPLLAGGVVALSLTAPPLLSTIVHGSYEVPLAAMVVAATWLFQLHLDRPNGRHLLALSAVLTLLVMTRSLFHPAWLVIVLAMALVARPLPWRHVIAAALLPLVVIGGWALKNQIVFGDPTMSSWVGFNLQRGVVAPMAADDVEDAVADGDVTPLAQIPPWLSLPNYDEVAEPCDPDDRHPAVEEAEKHEVPLEVANFNSSCFLPLYAESEENASALIRRDPGRFVSSRRASVVASFSINRIGQEDPGESFTGRRDPSTTWMDSLWGALYVPVDTTISMDDWNLPLLGLDELPVEVSLSLVLGFLVVLARTVVAVVRIARSGWRDRATAWSSEDVVWCLLGGTAVLVIVVSGLLEFGENGRFRSTIDPLLIALPLGLVARWASERLGWSRPRADEVASAEEPTGESVERTPEPTGAPS